MDRTLPRRLWSQASLVLGLIAVALAACGAAENPAKSTDTAPDETASTETASTGTASTGTASTGTTSNGATSNDPTSNDATSNDATRSAATPAVITTVQVDAQTSPPLRRAVQAGAGLHHRKVGGSVYVPCNASDQQWLDEGLDVDDMMNTRRAWFRQRLTACADAAPCPALTRTISPHLAHFALALLGCSWFASMAEPLPALVQWMSADAAAASAVAAGQS